MEKNEKMKRVLLVDGHGLAFRGFYALPEMNAPDGTPTNAVLGFFNMLLKAEGEWQPDGVALFFDPPGPTARNALYDAYKEGRRPTPETFKAQMPYILDLSTALGYPVFVEAGVEADDLIASTALAAEEKGLEVVILTADKDMLQILCGNMKMARPSKGISEFKLYDEKSFAEEYGFPPARMADYLALVGDAVDNIPGVAGIGDKTARGLLVAHGSLDGIYAAIDTLPKGQQKKLEEGREAAYMSYDLIVPQRVAAVESSELCRGEGDRAKAAEICRKLGMKSLLSRLDLAAVNVSGRETEPVSEGSSMVLREAAKADLAGESILGFADEPPVIMTPDGRWAPLDEDVDFLREWLSAKERTLILADYRAKCGRYPFLADHADRIGDVELAHYFYHPDAKSHTLSFILGREPQPGPELVSEILRLWGDFSVQSLAGDMRRVMEEIDAPLTPALMALQSRGLCVKADALRDLDEELGMHVARIEREICEIAGQVINLNSPKQVGELLFEKLRLPVIKKTKTGYSTDVSVLEELARLPEPLGDIPAKMLEFRECSKMCSGFVQPFLKYAEDASDGRIHSTFLHTVTGTGRLASRDPNVQNLPVFGEWAEKFRRTIVPCAPTRVFVAADYSQIELRVLAHLSGEERLLDAFRRGRDIHLETASWVFALEPEQITAEQRRFAKTVNFGLLYGMGAHGLAQRAGISRHQAAGLVERYFAALPSVKSYLEQSARDAKARGYTTSIFGRVRPLAEVTTVERRGNNPIDRVAVNTPIQSAAADIAKIALIRFHRLLQERHPDCWLVLQVHDSLICDVPGEKADEIETLLVDTMEAVNCIDVPLKADPKRGHSLADV